MAIIEKLLEFLNLSLSKPNLINLTSTLSISGFHPGWLFGVLGTVMVSIFSLSIGRTKAVISLLSLYVAFAFEKLFPFLDFMKGAVGNSIEVHWLRASIFVIAYVAVFFIFCLSFIRKKLSSSEYSLFGILLLSIIQLCLFISIIFNILPSSMTLEWFPYLYGYFSTPLALFMWVIAPLPVLFFIKK